MTPTKSKLYAADGTVCTRATGTYYQLPQEGYDQLIYGQD